MSNEIFIPIRCKECRTVVAAGLYPKSNSGAGVYCFNCAYSFTLVNDVLGTKFAQTPSQFLKVFEYESYTDYFLEWQSYKTVNWVSRIRQWYDKEIRKREQQNSTSET